MHDTVAIITPVGNEIDSIHNFYNSIMKEIKSNYVWILVFDSYSTDGTYEWIINHSKEFMYPIHIGKKQGIAKAYLEGYKYALGLGVTKVIEIDVGHPTELLDKFVEALDRKPVAFGTRYKGGKMNQSFYRKIISMGGTVLSKSVLGLPYSDCTSGFQGIRSDILKKMNLDNFLSKGHFYQTEFKYYCKNIPFEEIPFSYTGNNSSIKLKDILKSLVLLFKMLKREPIIYNIEQDSKIELNIIGGSVP